MRRWHLVWLASLAAACGAPTTLRLDLEPDPGDTSSAPLVLSVFDPRHALVDRHPLGAHPLPATLTVINLPDVAQPIRLVVARTLSPVELGAAEVVTRPHAETAATLHVSASTADRDGDGIPDVVDNCPDVPNPDQANATGGDAGDACRNADLAAGVDGAGDLAAADLAGVDGPPTIFDGGADAPFGGVYAFVPTFPAHQSLYYGGHDKPPATVTFSYVAGASVACSHDGGQSFAACDSPTSIVFTPGDYNAGHTLAVKLSKAGLDDFVWTFSPAQAMPGLHFYDCDEVVTQSEPTSAFQLRLAANKVLCVAAGVAITDSATHNDDAGMHIGTTGLYLDQNALDLKLLGTESNRPVFSNPDQGGDQGVLIAQSGAVTGGIYANLRLVSADGNPISFENNGGGNVFSYVDVAVTAGCCDQAVHFVGGANALYNCTIDVRSSPGTPGLDVEGGATVTMTGGSIHGRDDTAAVFVDQLASVTLSGVAVDNPTVTGNPKIAPLTANTSGSAVVTGGSLTAFTSDGIDAADGGAVSVSGGTIIAGNPVGVNLGAGGSATLRNVTVTTHGVGIKLAGASLVFDGTLVERLDVPGTTSPALDVAGTGNTINSTANGNHFCDVNPGGSNLFSGGLVVEGGATWSGSFVAANQVNGGAVNACP